MFRSKAGAQSVFNSCLSNPFVCVCVHLSIQGGKEFLMRAHFGLPSVENNELEGKPPVTVKFEIPYFTVSGIQVCVCFYILIREILKPGKIIELGVCRLQHIQSHVWSCKTRSHLNTQCTLMCLAAT